MGWPTTPYGELSLGGGFGCSTPIKVTVLFRKIPFLILNLARTFSKAT
jgi:hypothetical protein